MRTLSTSSRVYFRRSYSTSKKDDTKPLQTPESGNILRGGFNYFTGGVNHVVDGVTGTVGGTIGTMTSIPKSVTSKILDEAVGTLNALESKIDDKNVDISITFNLGLMSVNLSKKHK